MTSLPFEIRLLVSEFLPIHSTSLLTIDNELAREEDLSVLVVKRVDVCFRADRALYLKTTDEFQLDAYIPRNSHIRHSRVTQPDGNTIHIIYVRNFHERTLYIYDQGSNTLSAIDVMLNSVPAPMVCSFCATMLFITMLFLRLDDKISSLALFGSFLVGLFGVVVVTLHFRMRETCFWDFTIIPPDSSRSVCVVMFGPCSTYEIRLCKNPEGWSTSHFKPSPKNLNVQSSISQRIQFCADEVEGTVQVHGIAQFGAPTSTALVSRIRGPGGVVYVVTALEDQRLMLEFHTTTHSTVSPPLRIPTHATWIRIFPIDSERCALLASSHSDARLYLADSRRQTMTILAEALPTQRINITVMHNRTLPDLLLPRHCTLCLMLELDSDVKLFFVGQLVDRIR